MKKKSNRVYGTQKKFNFHSISVIEESCAWDRKYEPYNTLSIVVLSELYILMGRGGEGKKFWIDLHRNQFNKW